MRCDDEKRALPGDGWPHISMLEPLARVNLDGDSLNRGSELSTTIASTGQSLPSKFGLPSEAGGDRPDRNVHEKAFRRSAPLPTARGLREREDIPVSEKWNI